MRFVMILLAGLLGCGDDAAGPFVVEQGPVPCGFDTAGGFPLLALERDGLLETFLAPGSAAEAVAVDYWVAPAAAVDYARIIPDFDETAELDEQRVDAQCPATLPLASMRGWVDGSEVISAIVEVGHSGSDDLRRGRITLPIGETRMSFRTDTIDPGTAEDGDWWLVVEPLAGTQRIALAPARVDRTTFEVDGVPEVAATVALVQTPVVTWNGAHGVAYAPQELSSQWRQMVSALHFAVVLHGEEGALVDLTPAFPDGSGRLGSAYLAAGASLDRDSPRIGLETGLFAESGTILVSCDASALTLLPIGIASVRVADGATEVAGGPGEAVGVPVSCSSAEGQELSVSIDPINGRPALVVATIELGE